MFRSLQKETITNRSFMLIADENWIIWVAKGMRKSYFPSRVRQSHLHREQSYPLRAGGVFLKCFRRRRVPWSILNWNWTGQGMLWISFLDQQCDQFAGTISGQDEFNRILQYSMLRSSKYNLCLDKRQDIKPSCKLSLRTQEAPADLH